MTIRDCTGQPFKLTGSLAQYDPNNRDLSLLNSLDTEMLNTFGSPCFYYELMIQRNTTDPLYREDRGKIFAMQPVQLQCFYTPQASQNYLDMNGIDSPDEIQLQFNYRDVLQRLGHPPKIGSRIETPQKSENWEIIQRNVGEFWLWGELRLTLICQRYQESTTTGEGRPANLPKMPPSPVQQTESAIFQENKKQC